MFRTVSGMQHSTEKHILRGRLCSSTAQSDPLCYGEILFGSWTNPADGRLWRIIPNSKFHADQKGDQMSGKAVALLFHRAK
jgi:hypothetical protein